MSSAALFLVGGAVGASAGEITVYCQDIAVGCGALEAVVADFEAANPDDKINLELVNYQTILESLPIQLESGAGPDAAIVTDLGGLSRYYLDIAPYGDADMLRAEYAPTLPWLRGEAPTSDAINGIPLSMTVNGAYVNATLFDQAGIAMPEAGATWEDWAEVTQKVAEATGVSFPMEMDRSGHRFASLAISYGAELVDDQGQPVVDEGLKAAIEQFVAWHEEKVMPMDLWGAVGGSTHRELFSDFLNAETVFYFGGSWTIGKMDSEVGDLFDWKVVATPCGPAACAAMPGGSALAGFKNSKNPDLTGRFLAFVGQPEEIAKIDLYAKEIPTAKTLIDEGLEYTDVSAETQEALSTFMAQIPKIPETAYRFQGWRYQRAMMNAMTTRISQVLNNEMDVDTALERIKQDVELAIQAAGGSN
ncbi:sugar ABC transporter substrate-binding protein [Martelella endophytica]|uniref:Sugar ABC transporter substrate-binding protein n=2 Tax=Martelella endophytica TaxID=1486262 RepID=A0A0D5LV34_MAREN|nr:sugar ABC transporter substrate-binding protein [Martelella endophytica]